MVAFTSRDSHTYLVDAVGIADSRDGLWFPVEALLIRRGAGRIIQSCSVNSVVDLLRKLWVLLSFKVSNCERPVLLSIPGSNRVCATQLWSSGVDTTHLTLPRKHNLSLY